MPNDFKPPPPTRAERAIHDLATEMMAMKKYIDSLNMILHALIAVLDANSQVNISELAKTFYNQSRIENIRMRLMAAELEFKKQQAEAPASTSAAPGLIIPK